MRARNLYIGVVFAVAGIIWMLRNFGHVSGDTFYYLFSWQMALVVFGGYLLVLRNWLLGGILMTVGLVFMFQNWFNFTIPISKVVLPATLIAAGVAIAMQKR